MTHATESTPAAERSSLTITMTVLTVGTAALAGVMLGRGLTTWLEAISFVTGAICVWLTVRESVWNFPIGMANVATFFFVFLRARLYSDMGLQVVYFALGAIGWYLWLFGGANRTPLRITRTPAKRSVYVSMTGVTIFVALFALMRHVGGASPLWDALTTAICLCAQWLTDRKHVESWLLWIMADVIYVPLYASRELYLTALLYSVFLVMATMGYFEWRRTFIESRARGFEVA